MYLSLLIFLPPPALQASGSNKDSTSTMIQPDSTPVHPRARLNAPTLFVKNLPGDIKEKDILEAFKLCNATRVAKVKRLQGSLPGTSNARVEFRSIAQGTSTIF